MNQPTHLCFRPNDLHLNAQSVDINLLSLFPTRVTLGHRRQDQELLTPLIDWEGTRSELHKC